MPKISRFKFHTLTSRNQYTCVIEEWLVVSTHFCTQYTNYFLYWNVLKSQFLFKNWIVYTLCVIDQCVIDMYKTITKKLKAWWPSKIITLLIQKKKKKIKFKSNQNTKYDIIISDLKRLRIRQAEGRRLLSRKGDYWEWGREKG